MMTTEITRPTHVEALLHVDTAAGAIAQIHELTDRAKVASVGVALHHFTELLPPTEALDLHRYTTILSKQIRPLIDRPDGLDVIQSLVTHANRLASPNGQTAEEVCGDAWAHVATVAAERAASACDGALAFGHVAVLNLAVIRAVNAHFPWWGTAGWNRNVEQWIVANAPSARVADELRDAPERVPNDVLQAVIDL